MRFFQLLLLAHVVPLAAQSVKIYSEFQRIDPFGQIVPIDRSDHPREILSPALLRNAHSTFHIAVTLPPNTSYFLYVGSNPGNIIQTNLYKEEFSRVGDQWIPDTLTPVARPAFGSMPDTLAGIPGQTTRCYLLDIWVPAGAPVQRVRVEVLLKIGVWFIAPMEVRIVDAQVPRHPEPLASINPDLPGIADRVDLPAMDCFAAYLLGHEQTWTGGTNNIRDIIRRDAEQDMAIARSYLKIPETLWFLADDAILEWWMRTDTFNWSGAEWYLKVRDYVDRNPLGHE
jgi:hypothetical protein